MELYDVIIIGGGPAGVAAGVYCARKDLKTLLITESFGGQSVASDDIQNWIGEITISGTDLAKKLEAHVRTYPQLIEIKTEKAISAQSVKCSTDRICDFEVKTDPSTDSAGSLQAGSGQVYKGKSLILAMGARHKKLGIPGEDVFNNKGVSYCSTCDAPLFKDKKVAVVGGGNSGLETVHDLFPFASEVFLLEYSDQIKGDPKTLDEIKSNPKLKEVILNAQILEITGDSLVKDLRYKDRVSGEEKILEVGGVFVEIGAIPNSEIVKNLVQIDDHGQIMINFQHARTSHPGVFAAGDITNDPYKQNNIAVGDGVRAALAAYHYLQNREKHSPAER